MFRFARGKQVVHVSLAVAVVLAFVMSASAQFSNKPGKDDNKKDDDRQRQANDRAREVMEREAEAQKERAREREREREQMRRQRDQDEKRDRERQEAMRQEQQKREANANEAARERAQRDARERALQDQQRRRLDNERDRLEEDRRRLDRDRRRDLDRNDDLNRNFVPPAAPKNSRPAAARIEKPAKPAAAAPEPLSAAELAAALEDLASGDRKRVLEALERLGKAQADGDRAPVAKQIAEHLDKESPLERKLASKALEVWGTVEQVPQILELLDDFDKDVRLSAIHALGDLKDPRAIGPLADRLVVAADRSAAARSLKELGPEVEPAVLKHLSHEDVMVRAMTADVLGAVGGKASADALKDAVENDASDFVRGKARGAARAVAERD